MSVNLNVRRINDRLLVTLRRTPDVTVVLCDLQLDFDPNLVGLVDFDDQLRPRDVR